MQNLSKIITEELDKYIKSEIINEGYSKTLQDEELSEGVTYLHQKDTGLHSDIIVDCGKSYEFYKHPLCLYLVNGNEVIPVDILPNVDANSMGIPEDVALFIRVNYDALCAFANMKIDGPDFFDSVNSFKQNLAYHYCTLIAEMSNYSPDKTGLPIWVYIDDTNSYLNSGHNGSYRMKFQQDKDVSNPRLWMPISIPNMEIMDNGKLPPIKIPQKHVTLVMTWVSGNLQLLENLRDGVITGAEFKQQMKTMEEIKVMTTSESGE